ncbi:MAG: hypothetical protein NC299_13145 [Lachnospiraceae bacterium]|nr:hypothetical protein [Ruminococcus sp.]MCM1276283.1 hypothetical protein [Lachnospiraceae bacterium]
MDDRIYRIIDFPSFVDLITNKKERFVHPTKWEDTYEGIFFAFKKHPERCEALLRDLCGKYSNDLDKMLVNFIKCLYFPVFSYAQCWSNDDDSDALWRIYDNEKKSVQICTTVDTYQDLLKKLLDPKPEISNYAVQIKDIEYDLTGDNKEEMVKKLRESLLSENDLCDMYFHKRTAFEHEKEKRVLIFNKAGASVFDYFGQYPIYDRIKVLCNNNLDNATLDIIIAATKEYIPTLNLNNDYDLNIPVCSNGGKLSDYILSVRLNPFAADWIDDLVGTLCRNNGLNYEGKSKLYEED